MREIKTVNDLVSWMSSSDDWTSFMYGDGTSFEQIDKLNATLSGHRDEKIEFEFKVNGISMAVVDAEKAIKSFMIDCESTENYRLGRFNKAVNEKAEELIRERFGSIMETMQEASDKLDDLDVHLGDELKWQEKKYEAKKE